MNARYVSKGVHPWRKNAFVPGTSFPKSLPSGGVKARPFVRIEKARRSPGKPHLPVCPESWASWRMVHTAGLPSCPARGDLLGSLSLNSDIYCICFPFLAVILCFQTQVTSSYFLLTLGWMFPLILWLPWAFGHLVEGSTKSPTLEQTLWGLCFVLFWWRLRHVEVPEPGMEPEPPHSRIMNCFFFSLSLCLLVLYNFSTVSMYYSVTQEKYFI